MGFLDDVRRMKEIKQANPGLSAIELQATLDAEKHATEAKKYEGLFAPNAVEPYIEVVPYKLFRRDIRAHVKTYISIVGLQPEDMFAIYTAPHTDGEGDLHIVYRDRPEYEVGRRRYRVNIKSR